MENFQRWSHDPALRRRETPAPVYPGVPEEHTLRGMLKEPLAKAGRILADDSPFADAELLNRMGIDITGYDIAEVNKIMGKFGIDFGLAKEGKGGAKIYPNPENEHDFSPEEEYFDDAEDYDEEDDY